MEQTDDPSKDQIKSDNVVQQFRPHENEQPSDERQDRLQGEAETPRKAGLSAREEKEQKQSGAGHR